MNFEYFFFFLKRKKNLHINIDMKLIQVCFLTICTFSYSGHILRYALSKSSFVGVDIFSKIFPKIISWITKICLPNKRSIAIWTFKIISFINWFNVNIPMVFFSKYFVTQIILPELLISFMNWFGMSIQCSFLRKT